MTLDRNDTARWLKRLLVRGVERRHWYRLSNEFPDPDVLARRSEAALCAVGGISPETARQLKAGASEDEVEAELLAMERAGARLCTRFDPDFPYLLSQMSAAPMALYVAGELVPDDELAVAVVGPRVPSSYGRVLARSLAEGLARAGITVVSGFAMGVDAAAHRGAVEAGGRTIGVLGCGLSVDYPPGNRDLRRAVVEGRGALVSEYPMTAKPLAGHFPPRNTLIAGLSVAVIVVEAAKRSGALITARAALEENRHVYAVPGDVTREKSRGSNNLLRAGAIPLTCVNDLLEDLEEVFRGIVDRLRGEGKLARPTALEPALPEPVSLEPGGAGEEEAEWADQLEQSDRSDRSDRSDWSDRSDRSNAKAGLPGQAAPSQSAPGQSAPGQPAPGQPAPGQQRRAPSDVALLVERIGRDPMIDLDTLMAELVPDPLSVGRLSSLLLQLELEGRIRQLPGKTYIVP